MKNKQLLGEVIAYLLLVYNFCDGLYKIVNFTAYKAWISNQPLIRKVNELGAILSYAVPTIELLIFAGILFNSLRKHSYYLLLFVQLIFLGWVGLVLAANRYIFSPFVGIGENPTWFQKMFISLLIGWLSFIGIYLKNSFSRKDNFSPLRAANTKISITRTTT